MAIDCYYYFAMHNLISILPLYNPKGKLLFEWSKEEECLSSYEGALA